MISTRVPAARIRLSRTSSASGARSATGFRETSKNSSCANVASSAIDSMPESLIERKSST